MDDQRQLIDHITGPGSWATLPGASHRKGTASGAVFDALLDWAGSREHRASHHRHRHPIQVERTDLHDQDGYWKSFWDEGEVFYGHALQCKGFEAPRRRLLCVNESTVRNRARERLYVGIVTRHGRARGGRRPGTDP